MSLFSVPPFKLLVWHCQEIEASDWRTLSSVRMLASLGGGEATMEDLVSRIQMHLGIEQKKVS